MAELVEYSMVVMVSTLFVAGSVLTYDSFSSFESGLQAKAAFASVSELASQALNEGESSGVVVLPRSTISCSGGTLTLDSGSFSVAQGVPCACSFDIEVTGGPHVVGFSKGPAGLSLSVT